MITRRSVRSLRTLEIHSETDKRNRRIFDYKIQKKSDDSVTIPTSPNARDHAPCSDSVDPFSAQFPEENYRVISDGDVIFEKPISDQWFHSELNLRQGEML